MRNILVILVLVCIASHFANSEKMVGCYWRADKIGLDQIDVSLCTHVYFPLYRLYTSGDIALKDNTYDVSQVIALKQQNPSVKFIVSVEDSEPNWAIMALHEESRSHFLDGAINIVLNLGFDGIDVNWAYPHDLDRISFVKLLAELKTAMNSRGKIVTAVISDDPRQNQNAYDYAGICQNVDLLNVKIFGQASYEQIESPITYTRTDSSYDNDLQKLFESLMSRASNTSGPLLAKMKVDSPYSTTEKFFETLIENGCSPEKLVLGPASSGCKYENPFPINCLIDAPVRRVGDISYREICQTVSYSSWVVLGNDGARYAYTTGDDVCITYEDPSSVRQKGDIVKAKGLAGMFFFEADRDDYDGSCGGKKFPLILAARRTLGLDFSCTIENGYLRHPKDCTKYYYCNYDEQTEYKCPGFLSFRQSMNACVPLFSNPDCFSSSLTDFIRIVFGV